MSVIIGKELYKCYPGFPPVLRGVDIEVEPGEMVAVMGPSGCGKSTMLHILGMLHAPDSGQLQILGQDVLKLDSEQTAAFRRGNMGFVMQASNLFEHSTVFENVEFPLIYENVPPQERWERVIRALELVRLSARVHYRSNRLSGGEQQRVAIARAMVNNPRILLADEPTGALDARTSVVIMENFRSLCHNGGVAMVMVTHDPKMAEFCDSIYTLEDGILHCRKREPPKVDLKPGVDLLKPPDPEARGALTAWRFPDPANPHVMELAARLNGQGLLSRIYALAANGPFAGQGDYSLPLPVRHIGFWRGLFGRADASRIAGWALADEIQFFYASGARKVADVVWNAAKTIKIPFAFAVKASDISSLGEDCRGAARDAAFITCATKAVAEAFRKFAPQVPAEKIVVAPNPPRYAPLDEEPEPGMPRQPGQAVEILAMSRQSNSNAFDILLEAAKILKQEGANFRLCCLGKSGFFLRWRIFFSGLRKIVSFAGERAEDSLAEKFRTADAFAGWPLAAPGQDLDMPWPICEAMAFGLPLAVTGISQGMSPLKADRNCLAAGDPKALALALKKLSSDKKLASPLGETAKKDIRAWLDINGVTQNIADRVVEAVGLSERRKEERGSGK